jgi:hypothetical protein
VYTDMDSVLVRPIDKTNIIGVENCDQEDKLDWCIRLPQFEQNKKYYLPIGFLVLAPSHPLIYGALTFFDSRYDPNLWPCGTTYLTLSYARLALGPQAELTREGLARALPLREDIVSILPRTAFYPIHWQEVTPYFTQDDPQLWEKIERESYAIHIWGKMTSPLQPSQGSLMWRALNQFTISNTHTSDTPL